MVVDDLTAPSLTERTQRKASLKRGGEKGEARERSAFFHDVPFIVEFSYASRQNPLKARKAFELCRICPLHLKSFLYIRDGASRPTLRALMLRFHRRILNLLDNAVEFRLA